MQVGNETETMKALPILDEQPVRELVVISGKGGTGKTSIVASLAAMTSGTVLADCDVDAADLHLVMRPTVKRREAFSGGKRARIQSELCTACGKCEELCRFGAVAWTGPGNGRDAITLEIDPTACEGCGVCVHFCDEKAITFEPAINGQWFISETRHGPMVHAELGIAEENSGKLVSLIRRKASDLARQYGFDTVLIDGSPGVGCPVIASITGADLVLIVTEPTLSGIHDLDRVVDLTSHFQIPTTVCVNKWDINPQLSKEIEEQAERRGVGFLGRVRYDQAVTKAQLHEQAIVEYQDGGAAEDVREVCKKAWERLRGKSPK